MLLSIVLIVGIVIVGIIVQGDREQGLLVSVVEMNTSESSVTSSNDNMEAVYVDVEYLSLLQEGDAALSSDIEQAVVKYEEAIALRDEREEAYMKLLNLYIANYDVLKSQEILERIADRIESPSGELQAIIDGEEQKQWYLVGSKVTLYDIEEETDAEGILYGEEVSTSLTDTMKFYYLYDEQGRLVETNAGSLPSIYSRNDGTYREFDDIYVIDSDEFTKREGKDEDYVMYTCNRGKYSCPENIDTQNVFTFEYETDDLVIETVTRDGETKYKNKYQFDNRLLISQQVIFPESKATLRTNLKYKNDYVAYTEDGEQRYWEEDYDLSGKLNSLSRQGAVRTGTIDFVKMNYDYEDMTNEFGLISSRCVTINIVAGDMGGRNSDGTYYKWKTMQSGILEKKIEYEYVYCKPEEINEKIKEFTQKGLLQFSGTDGNVQDLGKAVGKSAIAIESIKTSSKLESQEGKNYSGKNLKDGKIETAWVEGADGVGKGETITIHLKEKAQISGLEIWNGYLASSELYEKNGKIKKIEIDFGEGTILQKELPIYKYIDLSEDVNVQQYAYIVSLDKKITTKKIIITILDAEPGNKYEDTCVSEIKVY